MILRDDLVADRALGQFRLVQDGREVEPCGLPVVDRIGGVEHVDLADGLLDGAEPELGEQLADLFGDVGEERLDEFGLATEALPQLGVLGGDTHGAGVEVAHPHHHATRHDEGGGGEAELLGAQERADDDVAAGLHLTVDLHDDAVDHWKAAGLDLAPILYKPELPEGTVRHQVVPQDHGLDRALDMRLIEQCEAALERGEVVSIESPIANVNRTVGTMLGSELTRRYGGAGLPDDTITIAFTGSAGQSFGAFLPRGITLRLEGDSNDYVGKGLSGGRLILHPPTTSTFVAEQNVIAGNVILYGATAGELFLRGQVGERFAVRNSGAVAVVEGVGDHACEYMTGGRVLVLGPTGRNFGAGMSGGIAYVLDPDRSFIAMVNLDMVDLEEPHAEDRAWLLDRVERHLAETGSSVARRLLDDWSTSAGHFTKVMPRDYKRVLDAQARAEAEGTDPMEAVMAASRA
jgi:glutamate synthase domain-containing protein 3